MYLSFAVNRITRLGHEGPKSKRDTAVYDPLEFRIVDCAEVDDFNPIVPLDASHQYYRRSRKVRADIASVMANNPKPVGGLIEL